VSEEKTCGDACNAESCSSRDPQGGPSPDCGAMAARLAKIAHTVFVLSGKGGVGKSTVAANLAVSLARRGLRTGLMDIDLHGPSIPRMLALQGHALESDGHALQPAAFGENLKVVSVGFLVQDPDEALIWRGPVKMGVIRQFLTDVAWGELDWLVVDSPPGTGDEPLSLCQLIPNADGAVVVTTPQDVAVADVRNPSTRLAISVTPDRIVSTWPEGMNTSATASNSPMNMTNRANSSEGVTRRSPPTGRAPHRAWCSVRRVLTIFRPTIPRLAIPVARPTPA